jgi:hypothetical protein
MMQQNQSGTNQNINAIVPGQSGLVLGSEPKLGAEGGFENNASSLKELKVRGDHPGSKLRRGQGADQKNQQKHQIEVMVLSKVDPIDSAFPVGVIASETNLVNSLSQGPGAQMSPGKQTNPSGGAQAVYH